MGLKRKASDRASVSLPCTEDLSDASETDDAYEEKVQDLKRQLKQLDDKTHPDYLKVRRKAEVWLNEEKQRVQILHEHRLETIAREYKKEMEACERDCELEKRRIQEYLVSLCEELKRRLEHDKKNIELTPSGDILDFKPAVTRKLRRRAGTDLPSSSSSNFLFWGDLLLCGPGWPLSAATHCKPSQTDPNHTTSELRSPIPTNGLETSVPDTNTGPTNPDAECTDGPKSLKPADSTTSVVQSGGSGPSSMKSNNLFGSLGMNLFDGSLLSHLLASINSCGGGGSSGSNSYMYFNNSGLYNFMSGPPSGSAAAAVAAGLLMPSALNNPGSNSLAAALGTVAITLTGAPQSTTKKRRQQNAPPAAQLNLLLPENDIYEDLTKIHRACAKSVNTPSVGGSRKNSHHNTSFVGGQATSFGSPSHPGVQSNSLSDGPASASMKSQKDGGTPTMNSPGSAGMSSPNPFGLDSSTSSRVQLPGISCPTGSTPSGLSVWIDDGRLYCGQKCFQYGASVILEGRDGSSHRCTGTIVAIGAQDIAIRRSSDHGICRITVQQLKQGRYVLWPGKTS
ncbi:Sin3 histone deacetylase corepressor complex component SDS3 [Clonorchis sinensis]|uniref:Sin3 histone deacetylase corepressor complex component SDS3 n=1 Tax=Clonorchis sinensis TaxID=79923 RepID=A0A8T1MAK5_CLOSI|nr:Sin3 histone deacetylase corepressor complex component SDS3 [Clonorchis sinensis]